MKRGLLLGAVAALSLVGASAAQAEIIYTTDPYYAGGSYIATAPGYVYGVPAPLPAPGYVVAEPSYSVVAEPPAVVYAPPAPISPPMVIAPRAIPRSGGIVTTGYSTGCTIDLRGIERCY